jgi:hypothetical protein
MAPEPKDHRQTVEVARRNWQAEIETAQTYRDLAARERDEKRKEISVLRRLFTKTRSRAG